MVDFFMILVYSIVMKYDAPVPTDLIGLDRLVFDVVVYKMEMNC